MVDRKSSSLIVRERIPGAYPPNWSTLSRGLFMDMANWQFWSALCWLIGSAWQATTTLNQMRMSTAESIHTGANAARSQVKDAWEAREEESQKFAAENDLPSELVGTNYTDIFKLAEELGGQLNDQRATLRSTYRSAFFGWAVIFVAAALGVIASWPT